MKKIILMIIGIMVLMFSVPGLASKEYYETNETISIDATYLEAGLLKPALANFSVESPKGETLVYQQGLEEIDTGVFKGNYTTPSNTGKYLITVVYYDTNTTESWTEIGRDSRYINVGYAGAFSLGEAPKSSTQLTTMWIVLGVLLILSIIGMTMSIPILTILSGIMFLIMSVVTVPFSMIIGGITIMLGVVFLLIGMFTKT